MQVATAAVEQGDLEAVHRTRRPDSVGSRVGNRHHRHHHNRRRRNRTVPVEMGLGNHRRIEDHCDRCGLRGRSGRMNSGSSSEGAQAHHWPGTGPAS